MVKPEWGAKRQCPHCGQRFYDLRNDPATCPECGAVFEIEQLYRGKRARLIETPGAAEETETEDEELVDDEADVVLEDEDEEEPAPKAAPVAEDSEDEDVSGEEGILVADEDEDGGDEALGEFGGEEDEDRR